MISKIKTTHESQKPNARWWGTESGRRAHQAFSSEPQEWAKWLAFCCCPSVLRLNTCFLKQQCKGITPKHKLPLVEEDSFDSTLTGNEVLRDDISRTKCHFIYPLMNPIKWLLTPGICETLPQALPQSPTPHLGPTYTGSLSPSFLLSFLFLNHLPRRAYDNKVAVFKMFLWPGKNEMAWIPMQLPMY